MELRRRNKTNSFSKPGIVRLLLPTIVLMLIVSLVFATFFSGSIILPRASAAATNVWDFDTAEDYTYDSNKVEVADGTVRLKAMADYGNGADGAITVSSGKNINTDTMISGRSCADGGDAVSYSVTALTPTAATLSATPAGGCLSTGDEVLLVNLQGTSSAYGNAGNYETLRIASVSTNTITFSTTKTKYYGDGASDDTNLGTATTNQRVVLQRVPNYTDATINPSQTLSASTWDGTKGGVLFFRASGTVTVNGTISMTGKGFRGGLGPYGTDSYPLTPGTQGESIDGNGSQSVNANQGGGGGGAVCNSGIDRAQGGGGGGGYGLAGLAGSSATKGCTAAGGTAGTTNGTADLSKIILGSGGGGGGASYHNTAHAGSGGNGGGIIRIATNTFLNSGPITTNGNDAQAPSVADDGPAGGGGGSGGSVAILGDSLTLGSDLITAAGGGKSNGSSGTWGAGGNGGDGGGGRIATYSPNAISGTTSPAASTALSESSYFSDNPTVINATAHQYSSINAFSETLGSSSSGTVKYQVSPDNGSTWYWYTGGAWTTTTANYTESNTASDINSYIAAFTAGSAPKQFKWKAFLHSDGKPRPQIDRLVLAKTASWDFSSAGDYTLSDSDKIEVSGGVAQLKQGTFGAVPGTSWIADSGGASWQYRKSITIDNTSGGSLTDYQVKIDEGEMGYWKMDSNANDASGWGYNGTASDMSWSTGDKRYGSASATFNGTTSYASVSMSSQPVMTVSFWGKIGTPSSNENFGVAFHDASTGLQKLAMIINNDGDLGITSSFSAWQRKKGGYSSLQNDGLWHHFVFVVNKSDYTQSHIYLDNAELAYDTGANTTFNSDTQFYVNRLNVPSAGRDDYSTGSIDELRMYNRALSTAEVSALYTGNNTGYLGAVYDNTIEAGSDLRFTTSDTVTEIPYWIENYTAAGQNAKVWVKVPSIPASSEETIYMYYGNASAAAASDGDDTFLFFDDFSGDSLDLAKWSKIEENATVTVSGGTATLDTGGDQGRANISHTGISLPYIVETRHQFKSDYNAANNLRIRWNFSGASFDGGLFDNGPNPTPQVFWNGFTGTAITLDQYTRSKQIYQSNSFLWQIFSDAGAQLYSNSFTPSSTPSEIFYRVGDNSTSGYGKLVIDFITVRKYAATEPTASLAETADTVSTIQVYPTDNPAVENTTAYSASAIYGFFETVGDGSTGTIKYQISNDNGTTWYYWDGAQWSSTLSSYDNSNTAAEINTNISSLSSGANQFNFKAFLHSDSVQQPKLDTIQAYYRVPPSAPTTLSPSYSARTASTITWRFTDVSNDEAQFKVKENSTVKATCDSATILDTSVTATCQEMSLSPNTQYTRSFVASDGEVDSLTASSTVSAYTLANVPGSPGGTITGASSLTAIISQNSNPAGTEYAIALDNNDDGDFDNDVDNYIKADGTLDSTNTAIWQTYAQWGGASGISITGLSPDSAYHLIAKARNAEDVETAFSTAADARTFANTPSAPTLTLTDASHIEIVINQNSNPSSTEYVFGKDDDNDGAIDTSGYVQPGGTFGDAEESTWQTYAQWGGASGFTLSIIPSSSPNELVYRFRVKARNADSVPVETALSSAGAAYSAANVPGTPAVATASALDKVNLIIDRNSNPISPADTQYAIGLDNEDSNEDGIPEGNGTVDASGYLQANGTLGAAAVWQTYSQWGGAGGTDITVSGSSVPNTPYRFMTKARNETGLETDFSTAAYAYTRANVPSTPTLTAQSNTTIKVVVNTNSNPDGSPATEANTKYSIGLDQDDNGSVDVSGYLQANGSWGLRQFGRLMPSGAALTVL